MTREEATEKLRNLLSDHELDGRWDLYKVEWDALRILLEQPTTAEIMAFCQEQYSLSLNWLGDDFIRGAANAYGTLVQRFGERDKA